MQNTATSHKNRKDLLLEIKINDRNYHTGFVSLVDAGGRDIGDIIVMKDITEKQASLRRDNTSKAVRSQGIWFLVLVSSGKFNLANSP